MKRLIYRFHLSSSMISLRKPTIHDVYRDVKRKKRRGGKINSFFLILVAGILLVPSLRAQESDFPQKMPAETNQVPDAVTYDTLAQNFADPTALVRTGAYWYWLSGNFSKEGVIKDLRAMKEAGINRAYIGDIGVEDIERGPVRTFSPEWWEIIHTALKTASELDIEMGIFNSPGWSQSGGPWVTPETAMRYLVSSKETIEGPQKFSQKLAIPGEGKAAEEFRDVKVIAYPSIPGETSGLTVDCGETGRALKKNQDVTIELSFNAEQTVRSLIVESTKAGITAEATLFLKTGDQWKKVTEFSISRYNPAIAVGFIPYAPTVISFDATPATGFRLVVKANQDGAAIRRVCLSSAPVVASFYEKTLAKMHQTPQPMWTEYQWPAQAVVDDPTLLVDPAKVIDLTDKMATDGTLTWNVPEGSWTVLRTGMTPTGVTNAPAVPEATGYETDKMSQSHIRTHFDALIGEILKRFPKEDLKTFKIVVQDSYEVGGQNFTDDFFAKFKKSFGYDPTPYLPTFFGTVVADSDRSDRFLWDLRRFIADEVAYSYVGGLRDAANEHGLKTWLECYGHWGFPGEFLQYGGQSNEIAGEYWSEGTLGDIENRIASSCGHIYGKKMIWAESNTCAGAPFSRSPVDMKVRTDLFFSEGINSSLLHLYVQQPDERVPGFNAWFGNEFNRHNVWFPQLDLFTGYLKRVNYMLQQGVNVADAAYFIGEDAPKMIGVVDPPLPVGRQFDFMNAEVIESSLFVRDGKLMLPNGTEYRVLVLPKLETMRPELLKKITKLVEDGAIVLGPKPNRSPSLENYPEADRQVKTLADSLWDNVNGQSVKFRKVGKGIIASGMTMEELFALAESVVDCAYPADAPLVFGHRHLENADVYFIANQSDKSLSDVPVTFRVTGKAPEIWLPVTGKKRNLSAWKSADGVTTVPLSFAPQESYFVVFARGSDVTESVGENFATGHELLRLDGPWSVTFDSDEIRRGPKEAVVFDILSDWSQNKNDAIKYFSGQGVYRMTFTLPKVDKSERIVLSLGSVSEMAKVKINGRYVGGVWTFPYELDVTSFVKEGENAIEIDVVNTWLNRLIGDARLLESERKTWAAVNKYEPDSPLKKSGLLGPVIIKGVK